MPKDSLEMQRLPGKAARAVPAGQSRDLTSLLAEMQALAGILPAFCHADRCRSDLSPCESQDQIRRARKA